MKESRPCQTSLNFLRKWFMAKCTKKTRKEHMGEKQGFLLKGFNVLVSIHLRRML